MDAAAKDYFAHPTAVIDDGAEIGEGTKIWHFSHVSGGAKLGKKCNLGQNVFVADGVVVGDNVKIQNNVSVYTGVVLEDDVFCGPSMVFTNIVTPRSAFPRRDKYVKTLVRRGATFGANSTVLCGRTIGENALVAAGAVVTKDVPAYALVAGVPAEVIGWACECGERLGLDVTDGAGAECAACGRAYERRGELEIEQIGRNDERTACRP